MMTFSKRFTLSLLALGSLGACLDPQVSDDVVLNRLVLPAGTAVPSAHDNPEIAQQIADNDGVDGVEPLLNGFANGTAIRYWDFGDSPTYGAPLFALANRNAAGELELVTTHPPIVDAIPGDSGYSPYWTVFILEVTDLYNGELITSFGAVEEAQSLGLVLAPTQPTFAINCPAVADDVALDVGGGEDPFAPPLRFYWQGKTVLYYDFGPMPIPDGNEQVADVLILSREGKEPISEPLRQIDITNDGDIFDTNNVFEFARDDAAYTPLTRRIDVTVPDDSFPLIDTTEAEDASGIQSYSDLFAPAPVPGRVVAFETTDEVRNLPQQSTVGAL